MPSGIPDFGTWIRNYHKASVNYTDSQVIKLRKEIDELKEQLKKQEEEMVYIRDVIGRFGIQLTQTK